MKSAFNGLDRFNKENKINYTQGFKLRSKVFIIMIIITALVTCGVQVFIYNKNRSTEKKDNIPKTGQVGYELDRYYDVPVYNNGKVYTNTYGENYSEDGYYYGYEWQCVEYVKRFYYEAKKHEMPDVFGNAKDFFDETVPQGELNESRDLVQYRNGENVKPMVEDLVVFTDGEYGHVAIITEVGANYIEVIQQNVYGKPREKFELTMEDGKYYVGEEDGLACWLRKE